MEPPVSDPKDPIHISDATAAAAPPLEPPGIRVRSHGLWVSLKPECSVDDPMANSSMFSFPTITAPPFFNFFTTEASYGGMKFSRIFEPQVVRRPFVQMRSLRAMGIPVRGVRRPSEIALSAVSACAMAISGSTVIYAPTFSSTAFMRSRIARVRSCEEISFFLKSRWASCMLSS